jgi:SAM-dependent methyltransferase
MRLPAFRRAPAEYDEQFMDTMASAYLEQTAWTRLRLEAVHELVDPHPGDRVLDLGCAAGAISHFLSGLGCETVGIDAEPLALEKARSLFPELQFQLANVIRLPFEDASFDKAVAADLVEHLDDESFRSMLRETRRVLRPGGTLSIYTPNPRHPIERLKARDLILAQNPTHIGLRDRETLERMLREAGFTVELSEWRASFVRGLRLVERAGGGRVESLRYRLCVRAKRA